METIIVPFPMLARDYEDHHVEFPCIVQPKLNGVRCLVSPCGRAFSRYTREFRHLAGQFGTPGMWLDGELWHPDYMLQDIAGMLLQHEADERTVQLQYHVFDIINTEMVQEDRLNLRMSMDRHDKVRIVYSRRVHSWRAAEQWYRHFLTLAGSEGMIYRRLDRPYVHGKSYNILKKKRLYSEEFLCIGANEGLGKFAGMLGAFTLRTEDGQTFNCGGGALDVAAREFFWREKPIGKRITVEFPYKTSRGVPHQSQFVCVRQDL